MGNTFNKGYKSERVLLALGSCLLGVTMRLTMGATFKIPLDLSLHVRSPIVEKSATNRLHATDELAERR